MQTFIAVPALGLLVVVLLGWLLPLVVGIVRTVRGQRSTGLIVFGGAWGLFGAAGLGLLFVGALAFRTANRPTRTEVFDPATYEGPTGTIVVPFTARTQLSVIGQQSAVRQQLTATGGSLIAPAGSLTVRSVDLTAADDSGAQWSASCFFRRQQQLNLAEGETQELKIGPPFTAKVIAKKTSDDMCTFDLKVTGTGGNGFTIRQLGSAANKAPAFEVLNKDGEVVWQGDFKYG